MRHDPRTLLHDMSEAAGRINRYCADRTFEDYLADDYFRSAVERQFEIIGEAMTRLRQSAPEISRRVTNQNKISGFRNAIVHGYDQINHVISWEVIQLHLPVLVEEVVALLQELA